MTSKQRQFRVAVGLIGALAYGCGGTDPSTPEEPPASPATPPGLSPLKVEITASPSTIGVGETSELEAWALRNTHVVTVALNWTSDHTDVVAVTPSTPDLPFHQRALVRGLTQGHAAFTVAALTDLVANLPATATITVGEPAVAIVIKPGGITLNGSLCESALLQAELRSQAGILLEGRYPLWTSSDTGVVSVDPLSGALYSVGDGTATITAGTGLVHATANVTVTGNPAPFGCD